MPAVVIESAEIVVLPARYLSAPTVRGISLGSTLRGKHREAYLADSGVTIAEDGSASLPLSMLRHLTPSGVKRAQRDAILAAHEGSALLAGWNPKQGCPLLASLSVTAATQYASMRRNGEKAAEGIALRAATVPCAYCLGAAVAADVKRGTRVLSREHMAALRASAPDA